MFRATPYEPVNTLKPVAENVWIVDGPVIRMSYLLGSTIPFPTRMTIIRLSGGGLWVHSPTKLTDALKAEVEALGAVRFLVAPNKIHYWWVGDWQKAFPDALSFAAPRVDEKAGPHGIKFDRVLADQAESEWAGEIDQLLVPGGYLTEADFFHRESKTLILTDLIENFEEAKVGGWFGRLVMKWSGVMDPHGSMPKDLRMTFSGQKQEVRRAAETMIGWTPSRIIIAHGRWYDTDAVEELKRAFAWAGLEAGEC